MRVNLKLHHVGYTVADIRVSAKRFALLGYQVGEVLYDEGLNVELCYLTKEEGDCNRIGASVAVRFVRGGIASRRRCHALPFGV